MTVTSDWYTVYVSQFGYGISPIAVSWLRSLPPGQNRSSIVRVCLNADPVEVLVADEEPAEVDELLTEDATLLDEIELTLEAVVL